MWVCGGWRVPVGSDVCGAADIGVVLQWKACAGGEGDVLPLTQVSRNFIGNLTPRRKTGFRKFPWKPDPCRETIQTLPPRLTPRDPSEPRDAPEGERKFAISGAKKSKSLKNCSLCAAKKTPNPTHIGIEPLTTLKVKT